ncbi:MAG TPA: sulfite exporter TauE/SafE family protein [Gemmatimonadaceae bacterium]|nr:sulfite exporter TauE/SafE family protein [Gemmatimonadaceae bacterium]
MPLSESLPIALLFFAMAALYASVGHAGASGYLAVMGLFGFAPAVMRPTALALNIVVALVAAIRFRRAGLFSWRLFWPFAIVSIPAAFAGGAMVLPARTYTILVGAVLIYAAGWMFHSAQASADQPTRPPSLWAALPVGLAIGLLSGLTGVGGGIFLSPILIYMAWADTRVTSGVAAAFILVNSIAGLLGNVAGIEVIPASIWVWAVGVLAGGWIGASYGSSHAPTPVLRRLLSLVLVIAGVKLILF